MKTPLLATIALAATTGLAFAADNNPSEDVTTKAMEEHPGTEGGTTGMPAKEPKTGSLTDKAQKDAPGTEGGMTDKPTAQPEPNSLSDADES